MWSAYRKCLLALLLGVVCLTVADSAPVIVPPPGGGVIGFPAPCGADGKIPKQSAGVWACGDDTGAGSGAPTDATYITQTPNATLTGEQALSALTSGLLLNSTGTGVLSIYGGSGAQANQFLRSLNASGVGSLSALGMADLAVPLGSLATGLMRVTTSTGALNTYTGSGAVANQFLRSLDASGVGNHSAIGPADLTFTPMQATYATHTTLAQGSGITVTALTEGLAGTGPLIDLNSSPQIVAGVSGQLAIFPGTSQANTVKLDTGTGLRLCGNKGSTIVGLDGEKPLMVFNSALNVWEELICPSLQKAYNTDRTIYGATNAATAVQIGTDPATHIKIHGSTVEGLCSGGPCDQVLTARTSKTLQTTYSDASTPCTSLTDTGVLTYSNNCRPRKSIDLKASTFEVDGTVCADPTSGTVNGSKTQVIICADPGADTAALEVDFRMPDAWDGGAVTVMVDWFSGASNLSGQHVDTDWNGVCVRSGDAKPAPTLTGIISAVTTFGNQANDERMQTTAPITLNGTCAGGAHVYLRGRMLAATNATMTNVRFLGAKVEYVVNAFSD